MLCLKLLQLFSKEQTKSEPFEPMMRRLAIFVQIRDDYGNLQSSDVGAHFLGKHHAVTLPTLFFIP